MLVFVALSIVVTAIAIPNALNGTGTLKLPGRASEYMTVYAPNAAINMSGNNTVYGAMIGSSISITGGSHFVYDRSLAKTMATTSVSGTYEPEGFSWSAY